MKALFWYARVPDAQDLCACCAQTLPAWLPKLALTNLDVSFCRVADIHVISDCTSLNVLCLQVPDASSLSPSRTACRSSCCAHLMPPACSR